MNMHIVLACLPGLVAVPLLAQPQIGGGTCSSATLTGSYSATLTGRDVSSTVAFTNASQAVGSATFDGLSKVTFTLTNNTSKFFGVAQTLSGTYILQANCVGSVTITAGDTASFTLEAYNLGKNYLMTGQDGVYALTANGSVLPATCPATIPTGIYAFNGSGFGLTSAAISGVFNLSGTIQISGTNTFAMTAYVTPNATKNFALTGTFTVSPNCTATASVLDATGTAYTLVFELTSATGGNFTFISSSSLSLFTGTGRVL